MPYKFIVSGSGSIELKEKIHELLVGRKRIFELTTLTFEEFVNFKTDYKYENNLGEFFEIENDRAKEIFEEYLYFGGYPRIVLARSVLEKQIEMNEISQSYLGKDISFLLNIQKTEEISCLVKILASQIVKLTNFSELSNTLRLSNQTLKKYLWYLKKIFIIKKLLHFLKTEEKKLQYLQFTIFMI